MDNKYLKALRAAFPYTLPILAGYGFLGMTKGIYMNSLGLSVFFSFFTSIAIFGGSVEFLVTSLLVGAFDPLGVFFMALMLSVRQIFYGISMLDRMKDMGPKKPYLIYALSDETFAINFSADIPKDVDRGWFMVFVSLLNESYWTIASVFGSIIGDFIPFDTEGIEFVMTTVFVVIFLNQWMADSFLNETAAAGRSVFDKIFSAKNLLTAGHKSAIAGIVASVACLVLFGADSFILPAMVLILFILSVGFFKAEEKV